MSINNFDLADPPPLDNDTLRVVPLGGLGDIGRNMTVLEFRGKLLVIDCGVLFPEDHQPGVDLILPDFSYISERLDDVVAIVLTHGHEDHIGAVPYLLRLKPDIPVVGSQLTLAFLEAKLKEHRITPYSLTVVEGQREELGGFDLEFVAVNHSIPDAMAVFVRTAAGNVLATGDFKMDQLPLDGRITDLRAFARLGEEGVDLFMVDSTNAEVPGFVTPEREIGPVLDDVFGRSEGKIVVASFASHVHRVQQVLDAAEKHRRKVALVGRSMVRNMNIAAELGYLKIPTDILVDVKRIDDIPAHRLVLMCTGSQGEPMAALGRIANQDHRVNVGPGDTVVLASSLIPGNESQIFRVINGLTRLGARVVHSGNAKVHVSGHAAAGELLYCYNILRPRNVLPIHGEVRHLVANAAIAVKSGIDPDRVVVGYDGIVVDLKGGKARAVGQVPVDYVYVDGKSVGAITDVDLKDRLILGEEGFVSIFAVLDTASGKVLGTPRILIRGVAEDHSEFQGIQSKVAPALEEAFADGTTDPDDLAQVVRRVVGRFVGTRLRRRPMIVPVVTLV